MFKKYILVAVITIFCALISTPAVLAIDETGQCSPNDSLTNHGCNPNLYCKPLTADPSRGSCERVAGETGICNPNDSLTNHGCATSLTCKSTSANPNIGSCEKSASQAAPGQSAQTSQPNAFGHIFGKIQPPDAIKALLAQDPTGAGGISTFLSNLIKLFYSIAAVVLIFMLLWGAFEWMTSGGEKEKLHAAQQRILSAIIGIILFAVTFAIISVIGQFTGFKFFEGQGARINSNTGTFRFTCKDNTQVTSSSSDYKTACALYDNR